MTVGFRQPKRTRIYIWQNIANLEEFSTHISTQETYRLLNTNNSNIYPNPVIIFETITDQAT